MQKKLSQLLDRISEGLAHRKGLLPMLGIFMVVLNLILRVLPFSGFWVDIDLFLHMGVVIAIFGFMLAWAL